MVSQSHIDQGCIFLGGPPVPPGIFLGGSTAIWGFSSGGTPRFSSGGQIFLGGSPGGQTFLGGFPGGQFFLGGFPGRPTPSTTLFFLSKMTFSLDFRRKESPAALKIFACGALCCIVLYIDYRIPKIVRDSRFEKHLVTCDSAVRCTSWFQKFFS